MPDLTSEERRTHARIAAHTSWAVTENRSARTAPARAALDATFDAMVPTSVTDPAERARRAEHFRKAHFARLALASAKARRARKAGSVA